MSAPTSRATWNGIKQNTRLKVPKNPSQATGKQTARSLMRLASSGCRAVVCTGTKSSMYRSLKNLKTSDFWKNTVVIAQIFCMVIHFFWFSATGDCYCRTGLPRRVYEGFAIELSICRTIWGPVRTPSVPVFYAVVVRNPLPMDYLIIT